MKTQYLVALLFFASCSKIVETQQQLPSTPNEKPLQTSARTLSYYISQSGDSTNSGKSPGQPWSISKANNYEFKPGDTINILGTVYGSLKLTESGTRDSVITITGGKIISGKADGIILYNNSNITISNIWVQGSGEMSKDLRNSGIKLWLDDKQRHANFVLENITAKGYSYSGIESGIAMSPEVFWESEVASMNYPGGFDNIRLNNCIADSNGYAGINIAGSWPGRQNKDVIIKNCKAFYNRGVKGLEPHSGNGIFLVNIVNGQIDSCEAAYNGWENGSGNIGIWTASANNVIIQHSKSYRNKSIINGDGGGFDIDGGSWNCTMQFNHAYENDGAGYLVYEYGNPNGMKDNIIRYNISNNDGKKGIGYGGITIGGDAPLTNIRILNNTIVQDKGAAIKYVGGQILGVFDVKNNILQSPESSYVGSSSSNNLFKNANLDQFFAPLNGSPAIDNGLELKELLPSFDYLGKPIRGQRDIGAIEF